MTHNEIVKEADKISKDKSDSWNCIFQYLTEKENSKLNHSKVYECQKTLSWYIKTNDYDEFAVYSFGFFFADYINQLISLRSKEIFIAYEKRMRSGAASDKEVNPTFDKKFRFFFWNFDENSNYNSAADISDKELGEIYDNCCWLWEWVKDDVNTLVNNLNYLKTHTVSMQDILKTYLYVRKMVLMIWNRQRHSSIYNKNSKNYYSNDDYTCITDEDIQMYEGSISYEFVEERTVSQLRYMGYETLVLDDSTEVFCKKYDIPNLLFLVAEDLMYFMLHQTTHNFSFCPECNCMFVTTHGNQKHCPACKETIRQKKRKENLPRYTHKKITDFINNNIDKENASADFRNESNYYWAIVQGKTPKTKKENWYRDDIKNEFDYQKWLDDKYLKLRNSLDAN